MTVLSDSGSRHLSRFWAKAGDVGGAVNTKLTDVLNARDEDFQQHPKDRYVCYAKILLASVDKYTDGWSSAY